MLTLASQIINYTEADQDLHLIQNALNTVESIVGTINESVREAEGQDRLRVLSEDLWIGGEGYVVPILSVLCGRLRCGVLS